MKFVKLWFSTELIGEFAKSFFDNTTKGCGFLIVTFIAIIIVCGTPFYLFVEVDAKPNKVINGDEIESTKQYVDKPVIVNNCNSTSVHKIQGQTISNTPNVWQFPERNAKTPIFEGIGFQGLSANVSSSVLNEVHFDQIVKEHNLPEVKPPILRGALEHLSKETMEELSKKLTQRLSIGEISTPDLEVPPGYFNVTSLRWKLEWERGIATINRYVLGFQLSDPENIEYLILRDLQLDSVTTKQVECDENFVAKLYESALDNYRVGNKNTGDAITEQLSILDPKNEYYRKMQELMENNDKIGGITPQVQIDQKDAAIRPRPCYPGIEGDSSSNYESAVRANEMVSVLSKPVPDECGYAINWLYIQTLEGREGYVSAALITIPDFETPLNQGEFEFAQ